MKNLLKSMFNVNGCTVVKHEQTENTVTLTVRLNKGNSCRCSRCGRKGRLYDNGREQRVWRTLDLGTKMGFIKMDTYRVKCRKCGVKTVKVPWASHKYITVVVDHDRRCVIWVHEGYGKDVLDIFMKEFSEEQRKGVELATCDGAKWIKTSIEEYLPNAERCVDGFHVVQWATDALGKAPEKPDRKPAAKNRTHRQPLPTTLQGYQLKEELRIILKMPYPEAKSNLDRWLWRASHSRIDSMKELYAKIKRNYEGILNTVRHEMSNARIEATNNKIKLLIRTAYGFRNMDNMLSLIMLSCSYVDVKIAYEWEAESKERPNKAA